MDFGISAKIDEIESKRMPKNVDSQSSKDTEYLTSVFKLIIIGDSGVGKSCLLHQLMTGSFRDEHNVTIGTDFGEFNLVVNNTNLIRL